MYAGTIEINEEVIPNLSSSLKPTAEGHNLAGVTDGGYELRSRGPASQGFEALDKFHYFIPSCLGHMIFRNSLPGFDGVLCSSGLLSFPAMLTSKLAPVDN